MRKSLVALLLMSAAAVPPVGASTEKARDTRPNVFLIVLDTLRADHLSSYGYHRRTSPNIDRLAADGLLYEIAISAGSWTLPAHASLFTGKYPRDHGTTSESWNLDASFDTLAEVLGKAGYHTGGFSNNVWTNDQTGLKQGFDVFLEMWRRQSVREDGISIDDPEADMGAAATTEEIFGWLGGLEDRDRPFFVFVNYFEPHLPYRPTKPHDRDFLPADVDPEDVTRLRSFYSPREYGYIIKHPLMDVSQQDIELLEVLYDAEIAYTDAMLGQLVDGLRSRGLLENTLLVITSDHGEHFGENHMLSHKLSVYDPLLRVPLILWNPRHVASGKRIKTQVQTHDVYGTILELTGAGRAAATLPTEDDASRYTFAELAYPRIFLEAIQKKIPAWSTRPFARALTAVRGQRYKLIRGSDGRMELYDIVEDPLESNDLAAAKPEVVSELTRVLDSFERGDP